MNSTHLLFFGSERNLALVRKSAAEAGLMVDCASTEADLTFSIQRSEYSVIVVEHYSLSDVLECVCTTPIPVMLIVLMDDNASMSEAVKLVKMGAYHAIQGPDGGDELTETLEKAKEEMRCRELARSHDNEAWRSLLVGSSAPMEDLVRIIKLVASRRCTVLITGETGTGKEMTAQAIHLAGDRSRFPMVALNCSAIPEHLLEAELFGHTKGAFTGAVSTRIGRFEEANNGTLFLDEIGDMALDLQAKLLRVLQERELQRLGSSETIKLNVRVIAASNMDLLERVNQGRFREDLYYRLNVVPLQMPALRERRSDILLLARHFVQKVCKLEDIPLKELFNETVQHLSRYSWPGNVRQLENLVEKAVVMSGDRRRLFPTDFRLPLEVGQVAQLDHSSRLFAVPDSGIDFAQTMTNFEKSILDQALLKTHGNRTLAADLLRIPRTTLVSKLHSREAGLS